jgi:hypothetical protein
MALADRVLAGDPRAVARAISLIENEDPAGAALIERAVILPQRSATPASPASLAKTAVVRGEKNSAKAIASERKALTAIGLRNATGRASYRILRSTVKPRSLSAPARSPATTLPATCSKAPSSGRSRAATRRMRSVTSPPALSTAAKPSARARAAVASPTAKSGTPRSRLARARACTPLPLVHRIACTPQRSSAAGARKWTSISGSTSASILRAASAVTRASDSSRGRVISARIATGSIRVYPASCGCLAIAVDEELIHNVARNR